MRPGTVARCKVHAIMKPGHAQHRVYRRTCKCTGGHADGLISHTPLPNLLMLEVKDCLREQPEKPLKYIH